MDTMTLVDSTSSAGVPAPFWFVQFFKVLGFLLHSIPMSLWYVGIASAMVLWLGRNPMGRRFSSRLMNQMPVIVAFGINLGIVPLLFLQLAYHQVFYPATILMAWFWLSIIALLIAAYYGVYYYAFGIRAGQIGTGRRVAGWVAAIVFLAIGFLFANAMSLTTRVGAWPELWEHNSVAGAALGTALNVGDASLWPRWLLMMGLAIGVTGAWALVDSNWFGASEGPEYRVWAQSFATRMFLHSAVWCYVVGAWYVLGTWAPEVRSAMFSFPAILLTLLTIAAPGLPAAWLVYRRKQTIERSEATWVALGQVGVLAINAISRQVVQNLELRPWLDVAAQPTCTQWSPLVVFLLVFVGAVLAVAWMVLQVVKLPKSPTAA